MIYAIIIGLSAVFAVVAAFKTNDVVHRIILIIQALGIFISVSSQQLFFPGIAAFSLAVLASIVYSLFRSGWGLSERILGTVPGFCLLVTYLFLVMHWPLASILKISMVVPLILLIVLLLKNKNKFWELAFVVPIGVALLNEVAMRLFGI